MMQNIQFHGVINIVAAYLGGGNTFKNTKIHFPWAENISKSMTVNVLRIGNTKKKNFLAPKKLHNAVNVSKIEAQKQEKY